MGPSVGNGVGGSRRPMGAGYRNSGFAVGGGFWKDGLIMMRMGIDLGGTKIEGIILDGQGREVFRKRVPTLSEEGYWPILQRIKGLYDDLVAQVAGVKGEGMKSGKRKAGKRKRGFYLEK